MKTFIIGTVGACLLLLIIGAGAQAQPADVTPGALARFKLEAVSFRALNETGIDFLGSDEVYVTIDVPDGLFTLRTFSKIFSGVDAGETTSIPLDQNCILPIAFSATPKWLEGYEGDTWSCARDGAPGPFSFRVYLHEKDWIPNSSHIGDGAIDWWDDLIGKHTVEYSMDELTALQVGQVKEETVTLSPCTPTPEQPTTGCSTEAEYQFTWRITRLPNAEPVVGPVIGRE
jgi:hypothetical protein